jgi:LmbE family N-acetylglucosaminyl deacetylase
VPLDVVAGRIGGLIERYQPQVVVTYDPDGAYQHPDHVHASRAAIEAVTQTGIPAKLYLAAMPISRWRELFDALKESGVEVPDARDFSPEMIQQMEDAERRITTTVDIRPVLARKQAALMAHASQISESWFSKIPPEIGERVFGEESFIRAQDSTGAPVPEDDLFAGLR